MQQDFIIAKLKEIHKKYRLETGTVAEHTKSAQLITREWQREVCNGNPIKDEVKVREKSAEAIDIVDFESSIVYEAKISKNNPHHEFYKDLIKVITYNCHHDIQLRKLVFLTEHKGVASLSRRLDSKLLEVLQKRNNVSVELISIN